MAAAKSSRADKVAIGFAIAVAILVVSSIVVPLAKPRLASVCFRIGTISLATEDYGTAIAWFDRAISLNHDFARAYCSRGVAHVKGLHPPHNGQAGPSNADFDLALKDFATAMQLNPRSAEPYYDQGYSYWMKGQSDRAFENFDQAIRLNPYDFEAFFARGLVHRDRKEYDLAALDYTECLRIRPNSAEAHDARGYAYEHAGKSELAIEDDDFIVETDPRSGYGFNGRCWHRAIIGKLPEALSDCKQALVLSPDDPATLDSLGFVYLKMKKPDLAIENYDAALSKEPKQAPSLYGRGMAEFQKGDSEASASDIEAAKALQPDVADEFTMMGVPPPRTQSAHLTK